MTKQQEIATASGSAEPAKTEGHNEYDVDKFLDHWGVKKEIRRTMIKMQLRPDSNRQVPYTKEEMDLATQWHFHSAASYDRMRLAGLMLPHPRTIEKSIAKTEVYPGFLEPITDRLKIQLKELPECARKCIGKMDEMDIMRRLEYDSKMDIIEGFEDLGHLGRTQKLANKLFALTLNGLDPFHRWRCVILYVLAHSSLKSENLAALIKQSIDKAEECGADVKMFVCDQGGPNIGAYKKLGVTEEHPFFKYGDKTVLAVHDFVHELKNIVSAWQRYGILIVDGKEVAFKDVITTCNADQNNKLSNTLGHIGLEHLSPNNFQRQNARLAFQLVSHRMRCAMVAAKTAEILTTETADMTIWFLGKMNTVSDVCNSSNIFDANPNKRPLSAKNPGCIQVLEDFLVWGPTIHVKDKKTGKLTRIPSFKGIVATVRGLLILYRDMVAKYTSFQLLTTFCNTDSVETLFSRIRGRGGYNPNPSARMVRLTMRHMVAVKNLKSTGRGNVPPDDGSYLPAITSDEMDQQLQNFDAPEEKNTVRTMTFMEVGQLDEDDIPEKEKLAEELNDDDVDDDEEHDDEEDEPVKNAEQESSEAEVQKTSTAEVQESSPFNKISGTFEGMSVAYFGGYTAYKTVKEFKCDRCLEEMQKPPDAEVDNVNEKYIQCREYETKKSWQLVILRRPTEKFRNIVTANLQTFEDNFSLRRNEKGLKEALMKQAVTDMSKVSPEWYAENDPCYQHRLFATMTLFTAKIHRKCSLDTQADKQAELMKRRANAAEKKRKSAEQKDSKKRTVAIEEYEEVPEARGTEEKNSRKARKLKIMKHE